VSERDPAQDPLAGLGINAGFAAEVRERWEVDPASVEESWQRALAGEGAAALEAPPRNGAAARPPLTGTAEAPAATGGPAPAVAEAAAPGDVARVLHITDKNARVLRLIHSYRARGHRVADSDPLGGQSNYFPELDPAHYGFGNHDMDQPFTTGDLPGGSVQTLREILERLRRTYCGKIGVEYTHVQDPGRKAWLQQRMEESQNEPRMSDEQRSRVYEKLSAAEYFERFLHTKFVGQKRFSLEGAEAMIPLLDYVVESAPAHGINELVLGMSHRGRLNVLCNVLGKSYEAIFSEFEDNPDLLSPFGSGDVKYHKGFSSDRRVASGDRVHLTLTSNPSHLEAVDPVVEGRAKAKQMRAGDFDGERIAPVVLHGDAAFAGQGMVAETLNLSQLRGYCTGGTIHVIVNNQIGFTTTPAEARSTLYCTDVAKMIQVPIFHVNGDAPEAVLHAVDLAMGYRERFGDDVVIDLVCYRRHGHNEGDEPAFTQPRLYQKIRKRPSVRALYGEELVRRGVLSEEDEEALDRRLNEQLQQELEIIHNRPPRPIETYEPNGPWEGFDRAPPEKEPDTGISVETMTRIAEGLGRVPEYFRVHPKLQGLLDKRRKAIHDGSRLDWAMGEAMAFGSLLLEGHAVRLSGQDSSRATFSQRHAVLVDQDSGEEYAPLDNLSDGQARFEVYDSLLSEAAVLGFEYGYSLADPGTLVLWEAQFGDFANGAQVIIDQFIGSAHVKWGRLSGLVMLLPHGYEGQGPEHSSARIERFLQTCAQDSMQIVNCTTPAQYFHVLRRQMKRNYRTPLVIFTPKSLLRLPLATSTVDDFTRGGFAEMIDDGLTHRSPDKVRRVLFSFGKVYYDLLAERERRFGGDADQVALVRLEQLYPWPGEAVVDAVGRYANAERLLWVQEEPANMGGWTFVRERAEETLPAGRALEYVGRAASASPATGSLRVHKAEQRELVDRAFEGL